MELSRKLNYTAKFEIRLHYIEKNLQSVTSEIRGLSLSACILVIIKLINAKMI